MTTYLNSFCGLPDHSMYGPRQFQTEAKAIEYKGYKIYERIQGHVWDIVLDGVCIGQNAGLRGAKDRIDNGLVVMKFYNQGYYARQFHATENPYKSGTYQFDSWKAGWEDYAA